MKIDVRISGGGTIYLLQPVSGRARKWFEDHVQSESYQWIGGALAVEHRYVHDLLEGARADGLVIE